MQFNTLLAALLASTAAAVDLRAWQGSGCDNGASVYWSNVAANTCFAFSISRGVRWYGIPSGAKGHVYYNSGCSTFAQEGGSGTYCLDAHNNMRSANWFYQSSKLVRREPQGGEMTSGIQYTGPDGEEKRVLATPGQYEEIFALVAEEKWEELEAYPVDPNPIVVDA